MENRFKIDAYAPSWGRTLSIRCSFENLRSQILPAPAYHSEDRPLGSFAPLGYPTAKTSKPTMTPEQRYFFDLTGYLHLKHILQGDELTRVQEAVDRFLKTPPEERLGDYRIGEKTYYHAIGFDPAMDALAVHPETWPIIREFTNGRPQMSGSEVICNKQGDDGLRLHCARESYGFEVTRYEAKDGRIFCNDCVVFFYLTEVRPGDGGLVILSGSHKASFDRPEQLYYGGVIGDDIPPGVVNITPEPGDVVIFSELTTHGVIPWRPTDRERRMVNYRYKTQHSGWEHKFSEKLKSQLPPALVELVSDEDRMHSKEIGKTDFVELE